MSTKEEEECGEYGSHMREGRQQYAKRKYHFAAEAFARAALVAPPQKLHLPLSNHAGCMLKIPGNNQEAFLSANQALTACPGFVKAWLRLGEATYRLGDMSNLDRVVRELEKIYVAAPDHVDEVQRRAELDLEAKLAVSRALPTMPQKPEFDLRGVLLIGTARFISQYKHPARLEPYIFALRQSTEQIRWMHAMGHTGTFEVAGKLCIRLELAKFTYMIDRDEDMAMCLEGFTGRRDCFRLLGLDRQAQYAEQSLVTMAANPDMFNSYAALCRGNRYIQQLVERSDDALLAERITLTEGDIIAKQGILAGQLVCYYPLDTYMQADNPGIRTTLTYMPCKPEHSEWIPSQATSCVCILTPFTKRRACPSSNPEEMPSPYIGHRIRDAGVMSEDLEAYFRQAALAVNVSCSRLIVKKGWYSVLAVLAVRDIHQGEPIRMLHTPYRWGGVEGFPLGFASHEKIAPIWAEIAPHLPEMVPPGPYHTSLVRVIQDTMAHEASFFE